MKLLILTMGVALALTACKTTVDPNVDVRGDGYNVELGDDNRDFCPPGHAKKGWC
tara:strand:- start:320321 stop:320485 length:165 start_codon:yes stop_codon:yes gene_type:complete